MSAQTTREPIYVGGGSMRDDAGAASEPSADRRPASFRVGASPHVEPPPACSGRPSRVSHCTREWIGQRCDLVERQDTHAAKRRSSAESSIGTISRRASDWPGVPSTRARSSRLKTSSMVFNGGPLMSNAQTSRGITCGGELTVCSRCSGGKFSRSRKRAISPDARAGSQRATRGAGCWSGNSAPGCLSTDRASFGPGLMQTRN